MRIGITYLYTIFRYGYPHSVDDALRSLGDVRKLGFRYLEMEGLGAAHMRAMYRNKGRLLATLDGEGIQVHNFCVVDPDLVSLNAARRRKAYDSFKMGAELGTLVGASTLHLASYAPPVRYLKDKPYSLTSGKSYAFADQTHLQIPRGFDWDAVWRAVVESCRFCADVGAEHGKTVIMEPRVGEIVCSVDSLLRLIEQVDRPNFKANFDTGHFSAQRENVPLALMKLCGKFANIHASDNNPVNTDHLPIGDGVIDWHEFFRVLKTMRYDGYIGLDLGMSKELVAGYRRSVKKIQEFAGALRLKVEI